MKWSISSMVMSAAVVGMLCIPRVAAASGSLGASGGTIAFTGSIVEPTCGLTTERAATWASAAPAQGLPHPVSCSGSNAVTAAPQRYTVAVVHLSEAEPDRVLKYFSDYVRADRANTSSPILVTQTYE
jgi:hypothetical protein